MKGVWRCAGITNGVQSVMTSGMKQMLRWSVDNLDIHSKVGRLHSCSQFNWTIIPICLSFTV